jgi:hypothetical protein
MRKKSYCENHKSVVFLNKGEKLATFNLCCVLYPASMRSRSPVDNFSENGIQPTEGYGRACLTGGQGWMGDTKAVTGVHRKAGMTCGESPPYRKLHSALSRTVVSAISPIASSFGACAHICALGMPVG